VKGKILFKEPPKKTTTKKRVFLIINLFCSFFIQWHIYKTRNIYIFREEVKINIYIRQI